MLVHRSLGPFQGRYLVLPMSIGFRNTVWIILFVIFLFWAMGSADAQGVCGV